VRLNGSFPFFLFSKNLFDSLSSRSSPFLSGRNKRWHNNPLSSLSDSFSRVHLRIRGLSFSSRGADRIKTLLFPLSVGLLRLSVALPALDFVFLFMSGRFRARTFVLPELRLLFGELWSLLIFLYTSILDKEHCLYRNVPGLSSGKLIILP